MEERTVRVGPHDIRIHELTTEDESRIRAEAQVWDSKKKIWETDRAILDASYIASSVVHETWPKEWGNLSTEGVRKLPAKLTRKLFIECNKLNTLSEDSADFLDPQQHSPAQTQETTTSSSTH